MFKTSETDEPKILLRSIVSISKIFVVTQPNFPVPSTNDGAMALIIEDTLASIKDTPMFVFSLHDTLVSQVVGNLAPHHLIQIDHTSVWFRIWRKLISWKISKLFPKTLDMKHYYMWIGLSWFVWRYHPDLVIVHSTKADWVLLLKNSFQKNTRIVWYHHNSEDQIQVTEHLALKQFSDLDGHIFVSNYSREVFVESLQLSDERIALKSYVIQNGVNTDIFTSSLCHRDEFLLSRSINPQKIVILFAGRLQERKGLHRLLDAFEILAELTRQKAVILIVGSSDYYLSENSDYIQEIFKRSNAPILQGRVFFTGYLSHINMPNVYSSSDILVFPSIEPEGMPLTVLEAQAAGLPVLASSVGGVREVVSDFETGYLFEPNCETTKISYYLGKLIEEPELRSYMSLASRNRAQQYFPRQRMANDLISVIDILCQKPAL